MSAADRYLGTTIARLDELRESQGDAVAAAGRACADSIAAGKLVFTFGTGHGSFAALETFPRTGTPVGFRPIVETPIALFHHVLGDMGSYQYRFLHTREGYGKAILRAHRLDPADTMMLFSHSGINAVILDMAVEAKQLGMRLVGVTSVPHSSQVESRHSCGKRLYELANVVVDTRVPLRDAAVDIEGLDDPVGPTSTVVAVAAAHAIVAATVEELAARGTPPRIMVSPNVRDAAAAHAHNDENYEQLWQLLSSR
ncbi:MAG: sugar isomerase domain-containing protein [Gaiellaceae bacterium]